MKKKGRTDDVMKLRIYRIKELPRRCNPPALQLTSEEIMWPAIDKG